MIASDTELSQYFKGVKDYNKNISHILKLSKKVQK